MKRISIFIMAIAIFIPNVAEGRFYVPIRYRIRYSPYVFDYHHSGLISGCIRYSPYAFGIKSSGLVHENIRYSPYAFGIHHSGLILDYGSCYWRPYYIQHVPCHQISAGCNTASNLQTCRDKKTGCFHQTQNFSLKNSQARKEKIRALKESRKEINMLRANDAKEIISNYLKSKNIDFRTDNLFRINNETLSANFLLKDKSMVIKYWNPEDIQYIEEQNDYKKTMYNKYKKEWDQFSQKHEQTGGKVYQIISADKAEILSKLELCAEL
jgi:hypothetical protein